MADDLQDQLAQLRLDHERLQRAQAVAGMGSWEFDLAAGSVTASAEARRIYGLGDKDWLIEEVQRIPLAEYRDMLDQRLMDLVERGQEYDVEFQIRRPNDGRILSIRSLAVFDPGRRVVLGTLEDVTRQRQAEQALAESERRLRTLLGNLPGVAYRCRMDREWTMEFVSEGCQGLTGYPPEALIDNAQVAYGELLHPDDRQVVWDTVSQAVADDDAFVVEYRLITAQGETRWVWERGIAVRDEHGMVEALEGFIADVSKRREAQQQLQQAQKLEAVGRLAGGVAHDFNNLLTVINSYSAMALRQLRDGDPLREDVAEILEAGKRAEALTRQLLAFGRKQVLQPRILSVSLVVDDMGKMLQRLLGEDVLMRVESCEEDNAVLMDAGQLEQVVMNLVINARDAMPEGGEVRIACRREPRGGVAHVVLEVADTGLGMDAGTRERIFEPFFTTKETGKGTGLGLSIAYGIVSQSGGFIEVDSEVGQGSRFRVCLPWVHGRVSGDATRTPSSVAAMRYEGRILLVEDDEAVLRLCRRVLEQAGYRVKVARSGSEALVHCEQAEQPFDLLLTDVIMPGVNGRKLSERLNGVQPGLRVLYMSGYADEVIARHGVLDAGLNYLPKPFSPEELLTRVQEILSTAAS